MKKLKKNNIVSFPSSLSDGEKEVEPQGECYSWIKKSVKRKI